METTFFYAAIILNTFFVANGLDEGKTSSNFSLRQYLKHMRVDTLGFFVS